MKQFLFISLAVCLVLLSGCQSEIPTVERLETEPTFLDATWQKETDPSQIETTTVDTTPTTEERSDVTAPTQTVLPETTEPVTGGMAKNDKEEPASTVTEKTEATVPPTEVKVPSTEATESLETTPVQTDPPATEPPVTEAQAEEIDVAALESYGRSYASSAYGYNGTSACTPGNGAGYFPAATKEINSMDEGYRLVCQAIDAQYSRDAACGYSPYEEVDGVTVRCPINIHLEATGDPNVFVIWVYYGGNA